MQKKTPLPHTIETPFHPRPAPSNLGQMMTIKEVLAWLPVSRNWLWRMTNSKNESKRIPSYLFAGKRVYDSNELQWWKEKHRAEISG